MWVDNQCEDEDNKRACHTAKLLCDDPFSQFLTENNVRNSEIQGILDSVESTRPDSSFVMISQAEKIDPEDFIIEEPVIEVE